MNYFCQKYDRAMLDHIHIENFRLFKNLDIPKVAQVNLITGKNNCGKTTLLEALRLWANRSSFYAFRSNLFDILENRGELNGHPERALRSIFHNQNSTVAAEVNHELKVFLKANDSVLTIKGGGNGDYEMQYSEPGGLIEVDGYAFIPPGFDLTNASAWRKIDLTNKEDGVAEIMGITGLPIVRVSVNEADRSAKVRLKDSSIPLPLKNFGEGMNRLLTIALGLVSAENGIFLIDEIDLGLHHSVQRALWDIVFRKARDLNMQVFATTHSSDCVEAFASVAQQPEYAGMGRYFRLQRSRKDGEIMAVGYDTEQLENALDFNSETR
jgi:predicted ATPase